MSAQVRPNFRLMFTIGGGLLGAVLSLGLWSSMSYLGWISLDSQRTVLTTAIVTGVLVGLGIRMSNRSTSPSGIYVCAAVIAFVASITGKYLAVQVYIVQETSATYARLSEKADVQSRGGFTADEISAMIREQYRKVVASETPTFEASDAYYFGASAITAVIASLLLAPRTKPTKIST